MTGSHAIASKALMEDSDRERLVQRRLGLKQRLGKVSIGLLLGGTLLIFACVAFLAFLWLSDESNTAWRNIVVSGWVTRSITIMAFVLRAVTAAQAVVATSTVASILLQTPQTKLSSAAAVSIARFTNTGPMALLPHLHGRVGWPIHLLLGTMLAMYIALQLTSTLLLSGVSRGTIVTTETLPNLNYGVTTRSLFSVPRDTVGYLLHSRGPDGFPAFAEYAEPARADTGDGIRDTGPSLRAFLPISTRSMREATLSYEGIATMLDTRVVCVRPNIGNLRILSPSKGHLLNGTIWTDRKVSGAWVTGDAPQEPQNFACNYALIAKTRFSPDGSDADAFKDWDEEWPVRLCNLEPRGDLGRIRSELRSPLLGDALYLDLPPKLIVHTTGSASAWEAGEDINVTSITGSEEWLVAETNTGGSLRMTLCNADIIAQDTYITANRLSGGREPIPTWKPDKFVYDVAHILPQLGIPSSTGSVPRGIFEFPRPEPLVRRLSISTTRDSFNSTIPAQDETFPQHTYVIQALMDLSDLASENSERRNLTLCFYCQHDGYGISFGSQVSPIPAAIFQGTLRVSGGNVALAMQALITTALGMTYYDLTGRFDKGAPAVVRRTVEVDLPKDGKFALLVALLGVHLLLVAVAVVWFARESGHDLVGSAWAAVAAVRGEDVEEAMEVVALERIRDSEVEKRMIATGHGGHLVGMDRYGRLRSRKRTESGDTE
ncbi:hypothetical protein QBC34DRAFT_379803 [Podospora aff. communis PSN243]|uniref:Uncharacterized protein n=1 Tax=Podospora aff. communis PSN243 TaxID=3040156 RepID=A0AAV9GP72_9PEZI|nr:hypothetical protein QBC34DRAFT_379803 [Podospora aff. communis PSN243]